jgi:hypothetical protein
MIKYLLCIVKNHNYIESGKCPFTGKTYMVCTRCKETVAK